MLSTHASETCGERPPPPRLPCAGLPMAARPFRSVPRRRRVLVLSMWEAPVTREIRLTPAVKWERGEVGSWVHSRFLWLHVFRSVDDRWLWVVYDYGRETRGTAPTQSIAEKEATAAARALLQADIDALEAA
jgi:hypothetical protein